MVIWRACSFQQRYSLIRNLPRVATFLREVAGEKQGLRPQLSNATSCSFKTFIRTYCWVQSLPKPQNAWEALLFTAHRTEILSFQLLVLNRVTWEKQNKLLQEWSALPAFHWCKMRGCESKPAKQEQLREKLRELTIRHPTIHQVNSTPYL
ncbi:Adenylate cyclase type 4 [Platysternon megacephalum]|uniref:Adenylate cyclase type 4 n=1 Tax=Platysternon megacephalum TaxID=55544 RepID=A0A4D9DVM0_9SAUR|nr:Adenylate cyclase type 4 [Platysternon megacephalum]